MSAPLSEQWRDRAAAFDAYARDLRAEGYPLEAAEAETIARDYYLAADEQEAREEATNP